MKLSARGFTLIEVLAVAFIVGIVSTVVLLSFRTGQEDALLNRTAADFESEIRRVQNLAIASTGGAPCGFGLHYVDNRTFLIYAGHLGGAPTCEDSVHNYQAGTDTDYEQVKLAEARAVFKTSFSDIFYEPPDPDIYINDSNDLGLSVSVEICLESNLSKCRVLTLDTAGRIVIQ